MSAYTVVGVFDERSEAQRLVDELATQGVSRQSIHLSTSDSIPSVGTARADQQEESFGEKVKRFFSSMTSEEYPATSDAYAEAVRRGNTVVTVEASDNQQADEIANLMRRYGSIDIDTRSQAWREQGWQGFDERSNPYTTDEIARERATVLPVIQEELKVGKRAVEGGGVRIHTRVTERPVEERVQLREEHVNVERRPVDRAPSDADHPFQDQAYEVREVSEELVKSKEARVVEEVVVSKESNLREETVRDTVRREDVDVEQLRSTDERVAPSDPRLTPNNRR